MARTSSNRTPEEHRAIVEELALKQRLNSEAAQASAAHTAKRKKRVKRITARLNKNAHASKAKQKRLYDLSRFARE